MHTQMEHIPIPGHTCWSWTECYTGVQVDNETLTLLIFYGMPESMYLWNEKAQALLWVPSDGGVCKHTDPQCSGILNPRKISAMNAEALMLDACDHCMPEAAEEMYE